MNVCMMPRPVIFDLDGTLVDSAPDIHACVNAVLRQHSYSPLSLDHVRGFIGGGVEALWHKIFAATGINPAQRQGMIAAFMTRYHRATALTRLYPDVELALGVLADRGHQLGICTNKPMAATEAVLQHFGIRHLFAAVVAGDTLPVKKPDPAPLRLACQQLGADPEAPEALYVGDSEIDADCAANLPVPFFLFTRGYRKTAVEKLPHHASFSEFEALPALIEMAASP